MKHNHRLFVCSRLVPASLILAGYLTANVIPKSIAVAQDTSTSVQRQRFQISQLPDLSRPIERKIRLPGGTVLTGFRYNPNTKEVGILLSGDHVISPVLQRQEELRPRYTNYNRITLKNFRYSGINVGKREVLIDSRLRYEKLEDRPWGGRYTTFDQAADIKLGANFEVKNRQLEAGTYIRRFKPDWASGPLGYVYSIFDAALGVVTWASKGEFIRISDMLGTVATSYVNLAQPQKQLVNSMFQEVNDWNSKGLVSLNRTDYDSDGIWMLFRADQNKADLLRTRLGSLVGAYFPDLTVNNQLNLVSAELNRSLPETQISACKILFDSGKILIAPHTDQEGRTWNGEIVINSTLNGKFSDGLNSDNITINLDSNNPDKFSFARFGGGQTWQGQCTQSSASGTWSNNFNSGRGTFMLMPK
jgi:hypothetical protein